MSQKNSTAALRRGLLLGLVGVLAFSLTLPFTRMAVTEMGPAFLSLGRALLAALCAGAYLVFTRRKVPAREDLGKLAVVSLGVVLGFPFLTAWAMRDLPAAHAGVVVGLLPLVTAVAGALLARERPSLWFWLSAVAGSGLVVIFASLQGAGGPETTSLRLSGAADLLLLGAVVAAAVGYTEGAKLSQKLGGLAVISWALVIAAPVFLIPFALQLSQGIPSVSLAAWVGFFYVGIVSQFLGFVPWYRGLQLGGIARVSQVQLFQPFFTLGASFLLLGEKLDALTLVFAVLIVLTVAIGRRAW